MGGMEEVEKADEKAIIIKTHQEEEMQDLIDNHFDDVDALPVHLKYSNFDVFCTFVSIVTYVFDLAMDIIVAVYFYHLGVSHGIYHYWYFGLTVAFILLPSLTMTGFSFRWYLLDLDNNSMPEVPLWRWVIRLAVLMLQLSPILRYFDSMRNGIMSRIAASRAAKTQDPEKRKKYKEETVRYYRLMVFEDADATLLRLFECFMESAPQLVLQIYILINDPHAIQLKEKTIVADPTVDPILKTTILVASVIASLVSLAWSLVVYHRSLRYSLENKKNISCSGSLFQFLWHFSSITARVLALSLFATAYPMYIFPVCAAHWLIMSSWLIYLRTEACVTRCEEFLFCVVLGAVYIFSFFNVKEERTRWKYAGYYAFCFVENTVLVAFWFVKTDVSEAWYAYPGIVGHYAAFSAAILFMVIYYACFHPAEIDTSGIVKFWRRKRRKRKNEEDFLNIRDCVNDERTPQKAVELTPMKKRSPSADNIDGLKHETRTGNKKMPVRKTSSDPLVLSRLPPSTPSMAHRTFKAMYYTRTHSSGDEA